MSATSDNHRRARRWLAGTGAACLTASLLPLAVGGTAKAATALTTSTVNDPPVAPHALTAYPSRDFVSEDGLTPGDTVVFEVTHSEARGGETVASKPLVVGSSGLAEVNHPGGTCWDVVTPNIVAGDTVRTVVTDSPGGVRNGSADVTYVADITAGRPVRSGPGTITLKGTAVGTDGRQFLADAFDARLVAPNRTFAKTDRRDLRAPGTLGSSIAYDEPGSTTNFGWTATWTGLTEADVTLALGAEAMVAWLGRDPAAGVESTIFETGAGIAAGPAAPCTAPKEQLTPLPGQDAEAPKVPAGLTATVSNSNTVTVQWTAATDDVGVTDYGVYRDGAPISTVQNADASAPAPTTFIDTNVPAGSHVYAVDAADAAGNRSAMSDGATVTTTTRTAAGTAVANPPTHPFTMFPSRDMIDVEGLVTGQKATVEVIRNGVVVTDAPSLSPDATGMVEINHVGQSCWSGTTPDLRTNDRVRATVHNPDGSIAWTDEATIANVTAQMATAADGVVTVHGTAQGHDGKPLPVDQIEQRLVSSSKNPFGRNGKRTLRADASGAADGTLSYDPVSADNPVGVKWTATYKGLSATDQQLATSVESRVMWLGRNPAAGLELTIFEVGGGDPPGPAGPDCVAPFEQPDTTAPTRPEASAAGGADARDVVVTWTPSIDDVQVYGYRVFQDDRMVAQVGGDATTFTVKGVPPGTHTYAVEAYDAASPTGAGATGEDRVRAGLGKPYGNTSVRSAPVSVGSKDAQAPSVPGNLQVTNPTNVDPVTGAATGTRNARLVFDPSTDDSGAPPAYEVYRDGVLLPNAAPTLNASSGKMTYTDQGLTVGQTYRYAVLAKDAAGNRSARTPEVSVTIAADAEKPVFTGTPTATVPDVHGKDVVISWQAATDNVGVTGYGIYRNGSRIAQVDGTTLTFRDVALAAGTYKYKVDAVDSAGNRSDRAAQTAVPAAIANDPPAPGHTVIAYPARDFVEGDGYIQRDAGGNPVRDASGSTIGQTVDVEVLRDGKVVGQARTKADSSGLVEVNHAGPGCWGTTGYANTPDLRPGDVARITPVDTDVPDQTTVSNVSVGLPIQTSADTVVVTGTAADAAGAPLPLDQLEARMISNGTEFRRNGRRALLAPGDGTLAYDAAGSTAWTATFTGLVAADVTRALGGEMVINWLGRSPLTGSELTIAENGPGTDGGPAAGSCTAPLDPAAPLVSLNPTTRLAFGDQGAVPATPSAPRRVTLTNSGTSPLSLSKVYLGGANPGDFTVTPATFPATVAPGGRVEVDVTFSPKAVGARAGTLNFADNAANTAYQSIALSGNGTSVAAPSAPTGFVKSLSLPGTIITTTTIPVTLRWNASAAGTVTEYQLQKSVAGGAFADVDSSERPGTATTVGVGVVTGSSTRFQLRACSGSDCSAWVPMAAFSLASFQENAKDVSARGTWTRSPLAGSFGGWVRSSSAAGTSVTLKTDGVGFQVISTRGPDRGKAEVWIDDTFRTSVNLYAPSAEPARVVATVEGLANATHKVELRVAGPAPSTVKRVDIDGFITLR